MVFRALIYIDRKQISFSIVRGGSETNSKSYGGTVRLTKRGVIDAGVFWFVFAVLAGAYDSTQCARNRWVWKGLCRVKGIKV